MKNTKRIIAACAALCLMSSLTACGENGDSEHGYLLDETTTTALTVEINTQTLAPEQEEQVNDLADSLTGELENKTIKWKLEILILIIL